ncbi:nitroreductase family protein [archaeon]|nr:MAG: nitroreductase family protein [archaeon]
MDVFSAMQGLNNVKKFKPDAVDDKLVGVILYMAGQATSAGNMQEWRFIVVKDEKQKERLFTTCLKQSQMKEAPVDIIVCADLKRASTKYEKRGELVYSLQDTAAAIQNMMISAKGLGLGAYWVRAFDEEGVKEIASLPENIRPIAVVAIGYPESMDNSDRFDFDGLTWVEKFGEKYEISYIIQQPGVRRLPKPIGNMIEDAVKKHKGKGKKTSFSKFLEKLSG